MKIRRLARPIARALTAALMISATAGAAMAQGHDDHGAAMSGPLTSRQNDLVKAVRTATERFKNVTSVDGPGEGYGLVLGCVSGGDFGAMGLHYLNGALLGDGEINAAKPEIILFEPTRDGGIRITGVDYIVFAADWDPKHTNPDGSVNPPQLNGQLFHLFDAPNRFALPTFYTLHVWAWKDNPTGTFTNWNPNVSCDAFNPRTPATR
jgi:hypothetical protein